MHFSDVKIKDFSILKFSTFSTIFFFVKNLNFFNCYVAIFETAVIDISTNLQNKNLSFLLKFYSNFWKTAKVFFKKF